MLFRGTIFHVGVCILPHHVIDGVHYFCHLLEEQTEGKKCEKDMSCQCNKKKKKQAVIGWFTSLVMQPSLLISYRLKAQLSLSVMEPLRMMDRLITKSYSRERKQALKVKTTIKTKKAQTKLCSICCIDTMFYVFSVPTLCY